MLSRPQSGYRYVPMHRRGQADVHKVDSRIGQQIVDLPVRPYPGQIFDSTGIPEIPMNPPPIPPQFLFVPRTDGRHLPALHSSGAAIVGHPHKSDADNANVYHSDPSIEIQRPSAKRTAWRPIPLLITR